MNQLDFGVLYFYYIGVLCWCVDEVLVCGGFDYLVIFSGIQYYQVFDDCDYLYVVNLNFKVWLLLIKVFNSWLVYILGKCFMVIFYQLFDYWYVVFDVFNGWWVEYVDIVIICIFEEVLMLLFRDIVCCVIFGELQSVLGIVVLNNFELVLSYLDWYCVSKMLYEIVLMCQVQCFGVCGYCVVEVVFCVGVSEFEIYMVYCCVVGQDVNELFYGNIIGFNEYVVVLYYIDLGCIVLQLLCSFLIDVGVSVYGYVSDIICIYVVVGYDEFQVMIDVVDIVQQVMCVGVCVGVDYKQLYIDVYLLLMGIFKDVGVFKVFVEVVLVIGVSVVFFLYGLGYLIGLQVYDVVGFVVSDCGGCVECLQGYFYLCLICVLELGMVVIIELGFYFIDMLLDEVKQVGNVDSIDWGCVDFFCLYGGICIEDEVLCIDGDVDNFICFVFVVVD